MNDLMNTTALWRREILRTPEDEGGGGDGYGAGEGVTGDDAPTPDRNAMLEKRLEDMGRTIEGFISSSRKRDEQAELSAVEQRIRAAERDAVRRLDDAEKALAEAYEDGDGVVIAKAQRAVAEQAAKKERVSVAAQQARESIKQNTERRDGGARSQGANDELDTTNLEGWKRKHSAWYGVDTEMTKAAHEIDARIREAGVLVSGSREYFEAVDRQMKQKYPDRFSGTPQGGSSSGGYSAGGGGGQGQTRIPQSVAEGMRRMGINIDDPEVAKRMVKNRETAVRKGWLPEQPVSGRILNR